MISQCALSITHSPIHTVEYYTNMAFELIELGADEICIKDMAGIGRPYSLGQIVGNIKQTSRNTYTVSQPCWSRIQYGLHP